mgnify:CR=1 FL=1
MKKLSLLASIVITLLISPLQKSFAESIQPFSTDGCSAYPDGIPGVDGRAWYHCCLAHDLAYWMGGPKIEKSIADDELNRCVSAESTSWHGKIMEMGVAIGGVPNTIFGWRWGYGFEESRSYQGLTKEEAEDALIKFDELIYHLQDIRDELTQYQRGYVIGRFSYLRRLLQDRAEQSLYSEDKAKRTEEEMRLQILIDLSMP